MVGEVVGVAVGVVVEVVEGVVVDIVLQGQPGDHSQTEEQLVTIVIGTEFTTTTHMVPLT